jgi:hypothetical protein
MPAMARKRRMSRTPIGFGTRLRWGNHSISDYGFYPASPDGESFGRSGILSF